MDPPVPNPPTPGHFAVSTQFTEDVVAKVAYPCDRCGLTIQPGQNRNYVSSSTIPDKAGKFVCDTCLSHYMQKKATLVRSQGQVALHTHTHTHIQRQQAPALTVASHAQQQQQQQQLQAAQSTPQLPSPSTNHPSQPAGPLAVVQVPPHESVQAIRGMISESQRRGSHTSEGRVTALPHNISIGGQNIANPRVTSFSSVQTPSPQALQMYYGGLQQPFASGQQTSPSFGYSSAHLQYANERERWSTSAYKAPLPRQATPATPVSAAGQIPLNAQARREVRILMIICYQLAGNKEHKTDIKEGMPVDYDILPLQLATFVKTELTPHLTSLCPGFPWDLSAMTVRESKTWQDVMKTPLSIPYFSGKFLKPRPGTKKGAGELIFSPPPQPVEFLLVIDHVQWLQSENFLEDNARETSFVSLGQNTRTTTQSANAIHSSDDAHWTSNQRSVKRKEPPSPVKPQSQSLKKFPTISSIHTTSTDEEIASPFSEYVGRKIDFTKIQRSATKQSQSRVSVDQLKKNSHAGGSRPVLASEQEVPFAKFLGKYAKLDPSQVKKGIFVGGHNAIRKQEKLLDARSIEHVKCFLIKEVPFEELCTEKDVQLISLETYFGVLSYDPKAEYIGTGAFKTAQRMTLSWTATPPPGFTFGIRNNSSHEFDVAAKRPYNGEIQAQSGKSLKIKFKRFNYADERSKAYLEGTSLGFASSLLNYSYQFIDHFILDKQKSPPPFTIPRLRFVKGAIALSETAPTKGSIPQLHFAYFLEELLPMDKPFLKYIHNGTAEPLQDPDEPGYDLGVFLCFIQHVQYVQTHGQTYTSDFQGAGDLLTDPQIMTKPSLIIVPGTGILKDDLFGDGNVNTAFDSFTKQHNCNQYCKWFELSELECGEEEVVTSNTGKVDDDADDDIYV